MAAAGAVVRSGASGLACESGDGERAVSEQSPLRSSSSSSISSLSSGGPANGFCRASSGAAFSGDKLIGLLPDGGCLPADWVAPAMVDYFVRDSST